MFNAQQFRDLIVCSSLRDLNLYSRNAEELLIFTCANESNGGTYLKQCNGPALGIYQIEPQTYNDIWQNYITPNSSKFLSFFTNFNISSIPSAGRLIYDLRFATAIARIFYLRINSPLPNPDDVNSIWAYYKQYYNTYSGKANKDEAIAKYHAFLQH